MPTHEQELAIQLGQSLVRIDALKFELAEAHERLAIITADRDELLSERDQAAERIAALEAERDRLKEQLEDTP
jgi:chromosome segregation ATPase